MGGIIRNNWKEVSAFDVKLKVTRITFIKERAIVRHTTIITTILV